VQALPKGIRSGTRYNKAVPPKPENDAWYETYVKTFDQLPTNWSWENATGAKFVIQALQEVRDTDGKKLAEAIRGMKIESPFGVDGTLTMRAEDHTLVGYSVGYGVTVPKEPFMVDFAGADWAKIFELESSWKKRNGFA